MLVAFHVSGECSSPLPTRVPIRMSSIRPRNQIIMAYYFSYFNCIISKFYQYRGTGKSSKTFPVLRAYLLHSSCMQTCTFFWQYCNFFLVSYSLYTCKTTLKLFEIIPGADFLKMLFLEGWVFSRSVISYMYLCSIISWLLNIKNWKVSCVSETIFYDLYFETLQSILAWIVQNLWRKEGIFHTWLLSVIYIKSKIPSFKHKFWSIWPRMLWNLQSEDHNQLPKASYGQRYPCPALLCIRVVVGLYRGSGQDRRQSLVEWGDVSSIRPSICPRPGWLWGLAV